RAMARRPGPLCPLFVACLATAAFAQSDSSPPPMPTITRAPPGAIYFPPMPPPLDGPIARLPFGSGRLSAPPAVATDAGEFFYPQLATRLGDGGTLSSREHRALDEYHAARLAALRELRAELERTKAAEPAARLQALQGLARRQA